MKQTELTYTNIFLIDGKKVRFLDMSNEEKARVSNQITRRSLETIKNTIVRETA